MTLGGIETGILVQAAEAAAVDAGCDQSVFCRAIYTVRSAAAPTWAVHQAKARF
jgi:hypothetical protein